MSPYAVPNPNTVSVPESDNNNTPPIRLPSEDEVAAGLVDNEQAPILRAAIDELRQPILAAARQEETESLAAVQDSTEYKIMQMGGPELRDAFTEHAAELARISGDKNLSAQGRNQATERAETALKEQIDRIADTTVSRNGDALLRRFSEPSFPSPDQGVASECQLAFSGFSHRAAAGFLSEATGQLRRAVDPSTSSNELFRINQVLFHATGPLVERRALSPERHARGLQPLYRDLAELIRVHLHTTLETSRHELAVERVSQARQQFTYLVNMARQDGAWDPVFEIGAGLFFGSDAE